MEIIKNVDDVKFFLTPSKNRVERTAIYKEKRFRLPSIKTKNLSLEWIEEHLSLMTIEAKMIKSASITTSTNKSLEGIIKSPPPSSQFVSENTGKSKEGLEEKEFEEKIHHFRDSEFRIVAFSNRTSYKGTFIGQGKKADFRNRRDGNKPSLRPAIDLQLENSKPIRIFGASLPACIAAADVRIGDSIEVTLVERGSAGMANQYFIQKI